MDNAVKRAAMESILQRAADEFGDVTQKVMDEYYQNAPQAKQLFQHHRPVNTGFLEASMVEQALYCFMGWFESPREVEMTLLGSVPHHAETLDVSVQNYHDLLHATASVIENSIPSNNTLEREVWNEARQNLHNLVDKASEYIYPKAALSS